MTRVNNEYEEDTDKILFDLIRKHTGREPTESEFKSCKAEVILSQR